ncbi:MAG: hypothetical protein ACT4PP_00975 [Sporichthyaceae bacterium]
MTATHWLTIALGTATACCLVQLLDLRLGERWTRRLRRAPRS